MLKSRVLSVVAAILFACWMPSGAFGAIAGVEWNGSPSNSYTNDPFSTGFSMGYLFEVTANVQVVGLGAFDFQENGLAISHEVGLWTSTGTLIASTTVQGGTASALQGHFRYESIAPVTLTAGRFYVVAAAKSGLNDRYASLDVAPFEAPGITYVEDRHLFTNALAMPTISQGLTGGWFGGNILLADQAAVPEPASLAIWGLGALGCVIGAYRRRKAA